MKEIVDVRRQYVHDRNPEMGYNQISRMNLMRMGLYMDPRLVERRPYIGKFNNILYHILLSPKFLNVLTIYNYSFPKLSLTGEKNTDN